MKKIAKQYLKRFGMTLRDGLALIGFVATVEHIDSAGLDKLTIIGIIYLLVLPAIAVGIRKL